MTELYFKGKEFVYNHHLTIPHRPIETHTRKGVGSPNLEGNLVIHGDNLHALKALQPQYAGRINCIFIDPPYNTGNEGWHYNDNVSSPMIKEWLNANPIGTEDHLRHDKWCAMMWPRLRLLHDLLANDGVLWMTIDENEIATSRSLLDEIFGEGNFVDTVIWHKNYAPKATVQYFSSDHDYILIYAKDINLWKPNLLRRTESQDDVYRNLDNDKRGKWRPNNLAARNYYSKGVYSITCPGGRVIPGPPSGSYWRVSEEKFRELDADGRIWWGNDGNNVPAPKIFLSEVREGRVPQTIWHWSEVGHTQDAKKEIVSIFSDRNRDIFLTPKPVKLIQRIVELSGNSDAIVLDSFAGSGTTAHAVMNANKSDNGNRLYILVEMEKYADKLTAERIRRVIKGYKYTGIKKSEIFRKRLNYSTIKSSKKLMKEIDIIIQENEHNFDRIVKKVSDNSLILIGENRIKKKVKGLGGGGRVFLLHIG